jgi:CRISPR/Cas system-associated exonuclease Cas4 (RecB family)
MSKSPSWSFSSIKNFITCPRQYYHLKVLKEYPMEETEAILYGNRFHKAAEDYIRDGTDLPKEFERYRKALDGLNALPGDKRCELKFALTEDLEPCSFKSRDAWWRGIADLLIIDGDRAFVIDYKTGASAKYADTGQLELMAMAVFKHYPEVTRVKAGLFFVVAGSFPKEKYKAEDQDKLWVKWLTEYGRLRSAYDNGVWNPRPSGLCKKHCPVIECAHNGRN